MCEIEERIDAIEGIADADDAPDARTAAEFLYDVAYIDPWDVIDGELPVGLDLSAVCTCAMTPMCSGPRSSELWREILARSSPN
jgi:hypothetical protein